MVKKDKNTIDMPEVRDRPLDKADDGGPGDDGALGLDGRSNVSKDERAMLAGIDSRRDESEDEPLRKGLLDSTDEDGTPLNEKSFGSKRNDDLSADDLDIPGEGDDGVAEDEPGEEDEENEDYSLSDNNDDTEINTDQ